MSSFLFPTVCRSLSTFVLILSFAHPEMAFSAVPLDDLDEASRRDGEKASRALKDRAEHGDPQAQFLWGADCIYQQEKDAEGLRWLLLAVKQGNADAEALAGSCYGDGVGTERNATEAIRLLSDAASKGNASALQSLGIYSINGLGPLPQDLHQAEKYLIEAIAKGAGGNIQNQLESVREMLKKQDSTPQGGKPSP